MNFEKKCKKSIFGPFLPKFGQTRISPKKCVFSSNFMFGSVTFEPYCTPNFMQNIRKNEWTNSEKNALLTDRRTWIYKTLRPPDGGPTQKT